MITAVTRADDPDFPFTVTDDGFTAVVSRDDYLDAWSRMTRQTLPAGHHFQETKSAGGLKLEIVKLEDAE